jgi:hypothetical protein
MNPHLEKKLICLLAFFTALLLSGLNSAFAQEESGSKVKFIYQYERPRALGEMPDKIHMVVPVNKNREESLEDGKKKIERLKSALGIKMYKKNTAEKINKYKDVLRVKDTRYRFKLYAPSGMIKFRDTHLYNQFVDKDTDREMLTEEQAKKSATTILNRLVEAGLLAKEELLLDAARVSFRKERNAVGAEKNTKEQFQPSFMTLADARVFVSRAINGLGVSGGGVNIVLDKRGKLAGLDLFWRDLQKEKRVFPFEMRMADAKKRFEGSIKLPAGSQVSVIANELVYLDPSKRDAVSYLDPGYIFVYITRVPIEGRKDEYIVSKVLHEFYPVIAHGREQLPSEHKKRLREVGRKYQMNHPETAEPSEAHEGK